jgi:hypothetical protein
MEDDIIHKKVLKCSEGILFSYKILQFTYSKLYATCLKIPSDKQIVYEALGICWSFIDTVQRIREIIQQFPTISNKDKTITNFLQQTNITDEYRNYIQHLRNELNKNDLDTFPVWGSLSWVDDQIMNKSYVMLIGTFINQIRYNGCTYNTFDKKWVSKVNLSIKNCSYPFDIIFENTTTFIKYFISILGEQNILISDTVSNPIIMFSEIK